MTRGAVGGGGRGATVVHNKERKRGGEGEREGGRGAPVIHEHPPVVACRRCRVTPSLSRLPLAISPSHPHSHPLSLPPSHYFSLSLPLQLYTQGTPLPPSQIGCASAAPVSRSRARTPSRCFSWTSTQSRGQGNNKKHPAVLLCEAECVRGMSQKMISKLVLRRHPCKVKRERKSYWNYQDGIWQGRGRFKVCQNDIGITAVAHEITCLPRCQAPCSDLCRPAQILWKVTSGYQIAGRKQSQLFTMRCNIEDYNLHYAEH
jgi:hypothetical protein